MEESYETFHWSGSIVGAFDSPALAKDIKIGLSWDARESALNQAWEDYMKAEAKTKVRRSGSMSTGS